MRKTSCWHAEAAREKKKSVKVKQRNVARIYHVAAPLCHASFAHVPRAALLFFPESVEIGQSKGADLSQFKPDHACSTAYAVVLQRGG
jgi:hypothetical protein